MYAPNDAVALLRVFSRADGINEVTFACSNGSRKMVLEMSAGPTLVQKMWMELDTTMDSLMKAARQKPVDEDDAKQVQTVVHELRIRARAQGEMLAMFMYPHFNNTDEIAQEAKRRWNARQVGDTEYETAGIGSRRFEPPPGTPARTTPSGPVKSTVKNVKQLSSEDTEAVKNALESGMFTAEQLAKAYGVSVDTVKSVVPA